MDRARDKDKGTKIKMERKIKIKMEDGTEVKLKQKIKIKKHGASPDEYWVPAEVVSTMDEAKVKDLLKDSDVTKRIDK